MKGLVGELEADIWYSRWVRVGMYVGGMHKARLLRVAATYLPASYRWKVASFCRLGPPPPFDVDGLLPF